MQGCTSVVLKFDQQLSSKLNACLGVDDVRSKLKLEEIAVELFNGFTKRTVGRGCLKPKISLIVTSNNSFLESSLFIILIKRYNKLHKLLYRNAQRILHIPFFEADSTMPHSKKLEMESALKEIMEYSSSLIGTTVKLGLKFHSRKGMEILEKNILPFVIKCLVPLPYWVEKGYGMLLLAAQLVRY